MQTNFAKAEMLIRRPLAEVFESFINPVDTARFWFTRGSGRLEQGKEITWTWEMYNHTETILVTTLEPHRCIEIQWGAPPDRSRVTFRFKPVDDVATFVSFVNDQLSGDTEKLVSTIRDSTEGFAIVLAGAKAWLEHRVQLNLVGDRFPAGLQV